MAQHLGEYSGVPFNPWDVLMEAFGENSFVHLVGIECGF